MKKVTCTAKEFMLLRQLANQYNYLFTYQYFDGIVEVEIAEEFCEAFGW